MHIKIINRLKSLKKIFNDFFKRVFDIVVSSFGLLILLPIMLFGAILIKIDSQGPVFYRGERVGRHGILFKIFKFRDITFLYN